MNNEKLKILTMLEEGKITSDEAVKLLNTFDTVEEVNGQDNSLSNAIKTFIDNFNKNTNSISRELLEKLDYMHENLSGSITLSEKNLTSSLKPLQTDLEGLIGKIIVDIDKNSNNITSTLSEEAAQLNKLLNIEGGQGSSDLSRGIDDLQKNLQSIPIDTSLLSGKLSNMFDMITQIPSNTNNYSKFFSKKIADASSLNLLFETVNGSISLEGYDCEEIEVSVHCKVPGSCNGEVISVIDTPETYGISINKDNGSAVSLDIRMPKFVFNRIHADTSNGKIRVLDLRCKDLICITSKARISLAGLECSTIKANTCEGKIELSDIHSKKLFIKTSNSPIEVDNISCELSEIITVNGNINLELSDNISGRNEFKLSTSNGRIDIVLSQPPETGLYIDTFSFNGNVNIIDQPPLSYSKNEHNKLGNSHIIGETPGYNTSEKSIKITAQTTNNTIDFR